MNQEETLKKARQQLRHLASRGYLRYLLPTDVDALSDKEVIVECKKVIDNVVAIWEAFVDRARPILEEIITNISAWYEIPTRGSTCGVRRGIECSQIAVRSARWIREADLFVRCAQLTPYDLEGTREGSEDIQRSILVVWASCGETVTAMKDKG